MWPHKTTTQERGGIYTSLLLNHCWIFFFACDSVFVAFDCWSFYFYFFIFKLRVLLVRLMINVPFACDLVFIWQLKFFWGKIQTVILVQLDILNQSHLALIIHLVNQTAFYTHSSPPPPFLVCPPPIPCPSNYSCLLQKRCFHAACPNIPTPSHTWSPFRIVAQSSCHQRSTAGDVGSLVGYYPEKTLHCSWVTLLGWLCRAAHSDWTLFLFMQDIT